MPIGRVLILLSLLGLCLAILGIAWATGDELYLFIPSRSITPLFPPPTDPVFFVAILGAGVVVLWFAGKGGALYLILLATGTLLGSIVGFFMFHWIPSGSQHCLCLAMIATTVYYWKQKDYVED
jgi:hypothetical protein